MHLKKLNVLNLRNLQEITLDLNAGFNFFWGNNGSGKTSLLESIHVLATGRSFRTSQSEQIISIRQETCVISGFVWDPRCNLTTRLGIERSRFSSPKIRIAEQNCVSLAELLRVLPLQVIHTPTLDLLEAEPQIRRQFLDWAMFHVEPSFHALWQRYRKALKQRNAALKANRYMDTSAIRLWDKEIIETGEGIDILRSSLLKEWQPIFSEVINNFLGLKALSIQYNRGWPEDCSLQRALDDRFERDCFLGYTSKGPHRADLEFSIEDKPAKTLLSRGQSKLFVCALFIARGKLLQAKTQASSLFLIDDLGSELDKSSCELLLAALRGLGGQVLITAIERTTLEPLLPQNGYTMFHVEHGKIN